MAKLTINISLTGLKTIKGGVVVDSFVIDSGEGPEARLLSQYYAVVAEFNELAAAQKGN